MSATSTLLEVLRRHYIKPGAFPGGIFLPECGVNGGTGAGSRADALYIGFTSTSGRLLVGHELKISRADWRKELDSAGKADFWADNCHAWYVVAPGPEIVPKDEVPHGWGLMYPSARSRTRMDVVIKPPVRPERVPSWTAVRSIMARLDTLQHGHVAEIQRTALESAREQASREYDARAKGETLTSEQRERLGLLERIERVLGVEVGHGWGDDDTVRPEVAAAALRLVQSIGQLDLRGRYEVQHLQQAAQSLLEGLTTYDEARTALLDLAGERR